jgi:hypothetical protein
MNPTNHICKLCGREEPRSENLIICAWCVIKLNVANEIEIKELLRRLEEVEATSKIEIVENFTGITLKEEIENVRIKRSRESKTHKSRSNLDRKRVNRKTRSANIK